MKNSTELTKLLSRIIRKNEPDLAEFNVVFLADITAKRPKVSIVDRKLLIPRTWTDIDVILGGLAPLIRKARLTMEHEAGQIDSKVASSGIQIHQAVEFLDSVAPQHLEAILAEAGFIRLPSFTVAEDK